MKDVKWGGIILVIFFVILGLGVMVAYNMIPAEQNSNYNAYNEVSTSVSSNIIEEEIEEEIDIEEINLSETDIEMDIKDEKDILLEILPVKADVTELKFNSTNPEVAKFKKDIVKSTKTNIYGAIEPIAEGECEIYVESNGIESNKVKIKIIDNERIEREKREAEEQAKKEAEEQARKEAEEKARREAEEQAKREAEEQARKQAEEQARKEAEKIAAQKAAEEQAKKQQQQQQAQSQKPATTTSTPQTTNSRTVYVTPTGKRYHYSPTCGGKNSTASTLSNAQARGLTPCKKCAQ